MRIESDGMSFIAMCLSRTQLGVRRRGGPVVASFAYLESAEMFGCGAGYHHLFIDAAGEACPCDLTPLSFGNVTLEPLADIWQRMGELFARPRHACLMGRIVPDLAQVLRDADSPGLPVPREKSEKLCSCLGKGPLPECYRRILHGKWSPTDYHIRQLPKGGH